MDINRKEPVMASKAHAVDATRNQSLTEDVSVQGIAFVNETRNGNSIMKISLDPTKLSSMPTELVAFKTAKGCYVLREDTMSKNFISRMRKNDSVKG